jgi:hypothetical protein
MVAGLCTEWLPVDFTVIFLFTHEELKSKLLCRAAEFAFTDDDPWQSSGRNPGFRARRGLSALGD